MNGYGNAVEELNMEYSEKEELSNNELIELAQLYLDEWKHRDDFLWRERIQFGVIALVASLLPWFANVGGFQTRYLPEAFNIISPIVGIALSIVFMMFSLWGGERLKAVGESYRGVIRLLPDKGYYVFLEDQENRKKHLHIGDKMNLAQGFTIAFFSMTAMVALFALIYFAK